VTDRAAVDGRPGLPDAPIVERAEGSLLTAMGIGQGDVVAVVGAGGKSAVVRRLALEGRRLGLSVLLTSTTHGGPGEESPSVIFDEDGETERRVARELAATGVAVVVQRALRADKWKGLEPARIAELRSAADLVLVEADGARRRIFKAPAAHEPVIPPFATHVVVVAAMAAVGQPVGNDVVHRIEEVCRLSGLSRGETLDSAAFCRVLTHPQCYPGRCPVGSRRALFLNTDGSDRGLKLARGLAGSLLEAYPTVAAGPASAGSFCVWSSSHLLISTG